MVYVARAGVGAYDQARHAQAVAVPVYRWRRRAVVEATPVIPGQEDRGAVPAGRAHDGVDERGHVCLPAFD